MAWESVALDHLRNEVFLRKGDVIQVNSECHIPEDLQDHLRFEPGNKLVARSNVFVDLGRLLPSGGSWRYLS